MLSRRRILIPAGALGAACLAVGLVGWRLSGGFSSGNSARMPASRLKAYATGPLAALDFSQAGQSAPNLDLRDGQGRPRSLADWKGKVVLVNLWGTWCPPCRAEMPALASLQSQTRGRNFEVVPIAIEPSHALKKAEAFLAAFDEARFGFLYDPGMAAPFAMKVKRGLPLSVLYDPRGVEIARLEGGADWAAPQALEFILALLQSFGASGASQAR